MNLLLRAFLHGNCYDNSVMWNRQHCGQPIAMEAGCLSRHSQVFRSTRQNLEAIIPGPRLKSGEGLSERNLL
jgi:hypothetical protein